jgi:ATP-dependent helicase HepA
MAASLASQPSFVAGRLFQHRVFGCCKVISVDGARVEVLLCEDGKRKLFSVQSLESDFRRALLHSGARAEGPYGKCTVSGHIDHGPANARDYRVVYDEGLNATVSETDLVPAPVGADDTLTARLLGGRSDPYALFSARHRLLVSINRFNRQVGGLRALLASRIDLHPHQAFVAGTVILDPVRRYVLADEVGLGKTIEAGIILHDLLSRRPDARVLVLTPGPLTRQWLCEMHSSFGGQGFRLADLHPIDDIDLKQWTKVICSTDFALDGLDDDLTHVRWDMVIVDEVHHLLSAPHLYELVKRLSAAARDLLLLSAVPVRRRESELYRLLSLLDPGFYASNGDGETAFMAVYAAQPALGRRLNLLKRDLTDLHSGDGMPSDVITGIDRLLGLAILEDDATLQALRLEAHATPNLAEDLGRQIHAHVSDRYRVNRRILRNRRERLISQDRLTAISRRPCPLVYHPDQLEAEAAAAVEALLAGLAATADAPPQVVRSFSHIALQSLCDSSATLGVLATVRDAVGATVNSYGLEMLGAIIGLGGDRWLVHLQTACAGVKPFMDETLLSNAIERASAWRSSTTSSGRWDALATLARGEVAGGRKTLIFAGFPGVAARLANRLRSTFGETSVVEFRSDLDDMSKEENVRRFRTEADVPLMVSDESGGEGRNFQFAHSLIHADLPWQPAMIEQRIGRLDRLGREQVSKEVVSHVCVASGRLEAGLYACYDEGLNLFGASISGLEFAIRGLQDLIVDTALSSGEEGLIDLVPVLRTQAADERVRDDSEALLDEAAYNVARAERFVRAPIAGSEAQLQDTFLSYFRALTGGKGVAAHKDANGATGLWVLRPSDVAHGELNIVDKDAAGELGKRTGTFERATAQARRDAEFFTYGNPLFDAVVASLGLRLTGRTYAIACRAPSVPAFTGLEVIVAARPRLDPAQVSPSLLNLAEAIFGSRRAPLFVPLVEGQAADSTVLGTLRTSLSVLGDGPRWRDLSGDEVEQIARAADGDLASCLDRAMSEAVPRARTVFAADLAAPIATELARLDDHRRALLEAGDPTSTAEAEMLDRYAALIESWDIVIDGVGFLALNPRV